MRVPGAIDGSDKVYSATWAALLAVFQHNLSNDQQQIRTVAFPAFGAGFGGSVWALVEKPQTERFLAAWSESYRAKFPEIAPAASFFTTAAGPAAFQVC